MGTHCHHRAYHTRGLWFICNAHFSIQSGKKVQASVQHERNLIHSAVLTIELRLLGGWKKEKFVCKSVCGSVRDCEGVGKTEKNQYCGFVLCKCEPCQKSFLKYKSFTYANWYFWSEQLFCNYVELEHRVARSFKRSPAVPLRTLTKLLAALNNNYSFPAAIGDPVTSLSH